MIPRLILVGLLAAAVVSCAAHHSKSNSKSNTSSAFTTSGPESAKSTLAAPPTANHTTSTTVSKLSRLGDLAESQSAQSSSVVHAPKTTTTTTSSSTSSKSFRRAASSPSTTSTTTTSTTPRELLTSTSTNSHHQITRQSPTATSGGASLNMPYAQQQMALMRAKPGQFTLVSNQQLGPGHVTMIGYTTPIVKVGGIVKIDQVAPGTMPRSEVDTIVPSPFSGSVPSASSAIYTSSGSPPMVSHHSQMINHGVSQKEGASSAPSPSNDASNLIQDSPQERGPSGGGRGSLARAELSASPGSSPYGSPLLGELPPGYSFAPPIPQADHQSALRSSPFGLSYQSFSPEALVGYGGGQRSSAKQQQSPPLGMTFSAPMEKPKPFLVYKPGYEGKMKSNAAPQSSSSSSYGPQTGGPPMMMLVNQPPLVSSAPPSYQQLFQQQQSSPFQPPLSPISMAHFGGVGQPKPLEKPQNPGSYSNLLPINDLEGNDLNSGPLVPSQVMPPFESQRTSVSGSAGQFGLVNQGGRSQSPQHQSMSIAKQMDSFAQHQQPRSQILNGQSPNGLQGPSGHQGSLSMMPMPLHHQQMPQQKPPLSPQGLSPFEQSIMQQQQQNQQMSSKMFGQPMQQQQQISPNPNQQQLDQNPFLSPNSQQQFGMQSQFERGGAPSPNSPSKFNFDQGASNFGAPESQVTSTIRMPESKSKVDPRQELQDQINFVLQNSPNLSAGSRNRHREDIFKAVQESLAESDNSVSRPSIMSSRGSSSSYFKQSQSSGSPFDLGSLTIDGLSQQDPPPSSSRSESSVGGSPKNGNPQSAYYPNSMSYKPSTSPSSQLIPDPTSSYYSRYNTENVHPFSPMEFAGGQPPIHPGTHSAAQASAALARDYKVKLQQEITRYLSDQMVDPAAANKQQNSEQQSNSGNFLFSLSPAYQQQQQPGMNFQQPPFNHQNPSSMLKYASSPLRKATSNLVDQRQQQQYHNQQPSSSALLLDSNPGSRSPRDLSASSNSQPTQQQQAQTIGGHHFVLGRHTEFVQSQASQPARTAVKAPEGASETSASVSSGSKSTTSPSSPASSSPFSALVNQLSIEASGPSSEAVAKTLRGYSEWWKESAVASAAAARPIVVHQLTSFTQK